VADAGAAARRPVAVIGAGAAGMAAAWTLVRAGVPVEVLERADRPGGRLRTERFEGVEVEVGAQFLASHQRETHRIVGEIGAASLLVPAPGRDALWRNGRVHPIQYGSVASMLTSGALPAGLKLRMASRYVPFLHRHGSVLDPNDPRPAAAAGLDDGSIAEWGGEHIGQDFVELLARPQTAAYYGAEPETTSAALYHALASAALDLKLAWVRGGMGALARRWADALLGSGATLAFGVDVARVRTDGEGVVVVTGDGAERAYRAAVLAVPAARAAGLLREAPVAAALDAVPAIPAAGAAGLLHEAPVAAALDAVPAAPSALLAVALDRPWHPGWFGAGLPRAEPGGASLAVVASAAGRVPGQTAEHRRVALVFPGPASAGQGERSPAEAFEAWWPAARPIVGEAEAVRARVYREGHGHALFPPGFGARLEAVRHAERPAGVFLAGDYLVSPTVEGAVRSGLEAARKVLAASASGNPPRGSGRR